MKITIISKTFGMQTIDTDTFNSFFVSSSSTIFKCVEHIFNEWFDKYTQPGAPMAKDIEGMYYGECDQPAIYTKRGAIIEAIENMIAELLESNKESVVLNTRQLLSMDLEATFS